MIFEARRSSILHNDLLSLRAREAFLAIKPSDTQADTAEKTESWSYLPQIQRHEPCPSLFFLRAKPKKRFPYVQQAARVPIDTIAPG